MGCWPYRRGKCDFVARVEEFLERFGQFLDDESRWSFDYFALIRFTGIAEDDEDFLVGHFRVGGLFIMV